VDGAFDVPLPPSDGEKIGEGEEVVVKKIARSTNENVSS
jgi:hypothetical protein